MTTRGSFGNAIDNYIGGCGGTLDIHEFLDIAQPETTARDLDDRLNIFYNDFIRMQLRERLQKEKADRIKNLKVGDEVVLRGFGSRAGRTALAYTQDGNAVKFTVSEIRRNYPCDTLIFISAGEVYEFPLYCIVNVFPAPIKVRGPDRRINNEKDPVLAGCMLHLVRTLESVARGVKLTEDQIEVLKDAQSKIRRDGSANGFRAGLDRRKF